MCPSTNGQAITTDMYFLHANDLLKAKPTDVILDVGCGEGNFEASALKGGLIVGVDIRMKALNRAKMKGLNVVKASAAFLPFKNRTFSKASFLEVIEHVKPSEELTCLQEIYRVLREKGFLVLSTPNKGKLFKYIFLDPAYCITKHKHFSVSEVGNLIATAGLRIEKIYTSGGFIYVIAFFSLYWRLESYKLLHFWPLKKSFDLLRKVSVMEFSSQKKDGCTIIAFAQKR